MVVRVRIPVRTYYAMDRLGRVTVQRTRFALTFAFGLAVVVAVALLALRPPSMWWWFR